MSLHKSTTGERYILYRESGSKNNPGGLGRRKPIANKEIPHYENVANRSRDFVTLYLKYVSLCPSDPCEFFLFSL